MKKCSDDSNENGDKADDPTKNGLNIRNVNTDTKKQSFSRLD